MALRARVATLSRWLRLRNLPSFVFLSSDSKQNMMSGKHTISLSSSIFNINNNNNNKKVELYF